MRPVNLLPGRYRPARASGERAGIGYIALGVLAVLLVMLVAYVLTNNSINDAKDKTAKANAELQAAQARVGQLQAYGNFASVKQARESAVESVAAARFDYERLMREMALVLPHNTYLTAFAAAPGGGTTATATPTGAVSATGPTLSISGCAPSHLGVATAIVRLRQIHNVADVNLASSSQATVQPGAAAPACRDAFTATVALQAETAPTAIAPVPARLGGGQ